MASYFVRKGDLMKLKSIGFCVYCGSNENLVIDHILPRAKGGGNNIDNLTKSCNRCNLYKSDFEMDKFRLRIELKRQLVRKEWWKWSTRIYEQVKRHGIEKLDIKLIEKAKLARVNHSYYSSIIGNIIRQKYKLF